MTFSGATEYAIRAVSELAALNQDRPVMLDELVEGTGLPREFVAKIVQKLVRGGVLRSAKGRGGGFALARAAHQTTLMDVVEAVDGPRSFDRCVVGFDRCNDQMPCPQHDLFKPIRQRLNDYLRTTTMADLAASLKAKKQWRHFRVVAVSAGTVTSG